MNTLQVVSIVVSIVCVIITTVIAWVMLNKTTKTEVSFTGTPVDKSDFDRHVAQNREEHQDLYGKYNAVSPKLSSIDATLHEVKESVALIRLENAKHHRQL